MCYKLPDQLTSMADRYLWDRTPAGAQVLVSTQDLTPRTSISASALSSIAGGLASGACGSVPLRLTFASTSTFQLTALLQATDPLAAAGGGGGGGGGGQHGGEATRVVCALLGEQQEGEHGGAAGDREALEAAGGDDKALSAVLCAKLDTQGPARIAEIFALSLCAVPAGATRAAPTLLGRLALPGCDLLVTPLFAKRLCGTPLAEALLRPGRMAPGRSGFLSMDQARSLLPLEAEDENVHTIPLVGVWVKGPDSPLHPLVAAACLKFHYASTLLDRALQGDGSFLLLLCPEGQPVSRCYEVRSTEPACLPLATYSLAADLEPARQLERHPSGLIPLGWAADARCPPPLALPPPAPAPQPLQQAGQLGAARRSLQSAGGPSSPPGVRSSSGPASLPCYGAEGSPVAPLRGMGTAGATMGAGGLRYARSGSSSSAGTGPYGAAAAAAGEEAEPRPRPSPWGLRPYGSPRVGGLSGGEAVPPPSPGDPSADPWGAGGAGAAGGGGGGLGRPQQQQQQQQYPRQYGAWSAADEESEDGVRADGVRLGSPVRVERAGGAPTLVQASAAAPLGSMPGSPSLPALLGGPYAPSPRHTVHGAGGAFSPGRPHDALRDSLDTGRRAVSAAAAAIASAEAAVLRGSGGGGQGGAGAAAAVGGAGAAAAPADDPLQWSLRQSATAVGGLAAALGAAASALGAPEAGAYGGAPGSPPRWPHVVVASSADSWGGAYTVHQPGTTGAEAGALRWPQQQAGDQHHVGSGADPAAPPPPLSPVPPPTSVVAVASWSPPGGSTRELQEEVARLRAELARMQQMLQDATRLPQPGSQAAPLQLAAGDAGDVPAPLLLEHQHSQAQPGALAAAPDAVAGTGATAPLPPPLAQQQQQQHPSQQQAGPAHPSSSPGREASAAVARRSRLSQSSSGVGGDGQHQEQAEAAPEADSSAAKAAAAVAVAAMTAAARYSVGSPLAAARRRGRAAHPELDSSVASSGGFSYLSDAEGGGGDGAQPSPSIADVVAGVAALFQGRPAASPASTPAASGSAAAAALGSRPGTARASHGAFAGGSLRGSYSTVRSSAPLSPVGGVVRTAYTPLSSEGEEEGEEDELEARLMAKYGLAR
ncbi:MAG: hypothetical protein J3K34DRAFT_524705 [Monoraphidium minutum]|nr:MAG: hypothetical protein J3K34DRAFT_524705 [Monoraphidium minutum]